MKQIFFTLSLLLLLSACNAPKKAVTLKINDPDLVLASDKKYNIISRKIIHRDPSMLKEIDSEELIGKNGQVGFDLCIDELGNVTSVIYINELSNITDQNFIQKAKNSLMKYKYEPGPSEECGLYKIKLSTE